MRHSSSVAREEEAKEGFKTDEEIKIVRSGEDGKGRKKVRWDSRLRPG
jgi:hypothetical protein